MGASEALHLLCVEAPESVGVLRRALPRAQVRVGSLKSAVAGAEWARVLVLGRVEGARSTLQELMATCPRATLVVDPDEDPSWLGLGALAVHPTGVGEEFVRLVQSAEAVTPVRHPRPRRAPPKALTLTQSSLPQVGSVRAVGVVSSTGGQSALVALLRELPADSRLSVLIVQHLGGTFLPFLARSLARTCALPVELAPLGAPLRPGRVWVAPPGGDLVLKDGLLRQVEPDPQAAHVPGGDPLLHSLALSLGPQAAGVILSGIGEDGVLGALALSRAGGRVYAQDEETCAVFGMPQAAFTRGAASELLSPTQIGRRLTRLSNPR